MSRGAAAAVALHGVAHAGRSAPRYWRGCVAARTRRLRSGCADEAAPGILETNLAENRPIGPERAAQHERVAAVVLRSGHAVAVAEAIQLLGVERVHGPIHLVLQ